MGFLIPVVSMAVFAAVVAGILAWVSSVLALEGEAKVKISNNGHSFKLPMGANLMNGMGELGYSLMAQCGGGGTCATCRVKVISGIDEPNSAMLGPLSPKLQKDGWILSCQTTVMNDVEVELFEPLVQEWPAEISSDEGEDAAEAAEEQLPAEVAALRARLPGFDCDACGYPTCAAYAQAIVDGEAGLDACLPGGAPVLEQLKAAAQEAGVVTLSPAAGKIRHALPGFDCDACGYPTCNAYASAVASGEAGTDACTPGGEPVRNALEKIAEEEGVSAGA